MAPLGCVEQFQVFSAQFNQDTIYQVSKLAIEVNTFVRKKIDNSIPVKDVQWIQTPIDNSETGITETRLTAIITYILSISTSE